MKNGVWILFLVFLLVGNYAFAQKNKVKGKQPADGKEAHIAPPDTNITKAAIRGSANMQAARDSLRGAKLEPPVDVVDTFNVLPQYQTGVSRLRIAQIQAGEERIKDLQASLERASKQLEAAKQNGSVSPAHAKELETRIKADQARVNQAEAKMNAIRKEWDRQHGFSNTEPAVKTSPKPSNPKPQPAPSGNQPPAPPVTGNKGAIKGKGQ